MYKFAASDAIFDGVSNIYLISIATAFLAVIIAFYCSNFLKDESEQQISQDLGDDVAVEENDILEDDNDQYLTNDTPTESELETDYNLKKQIHRRLPDEVKDGDYDCNSESNDENEDMAKEDIRDGHMKQNDSVGNAKQDTDDDSDEELSLVDGIVSKMKSNRLKELEAQLTQDQLEEERRIEREQLAAIFELLKKQEAELNMKEIDERELNAQLSLYR